jgi:hypothetical protein
MGKKSKLVKNNTNNKNLYSFGLSVIDPEKTYDRNKEGMYHTTLGDSDFKSLLKEDGKGKIRINFKKQKSKFQGGENPGIVPDETKAQTSASIGKDYIGFQIKKKFSRGGGVAIKGLNFKGVF